MKRTYPYTGSNPQPHGAQQPAYGQPPPPAGPAPPLPSSGPPQAAAYANYGYDTVAPQRHAAASGDAQQPHWNQQQWQQTQQYYPSQPRPNATAAPGSGQYAPPRPSPQSAPYRPMAAPITGSPSVNQAAAYSPHHPQQPMPYSYPSQASPMQSQSPSHPQPAAPTSYGYTPSVPQPPIAQPPNHGHGNAQNWPGAYATGSQVGPPSKKPRYQAPAAPVPAPPQPYLSSGAPPMPSMGGGMAGGAMNQYHPAPPAHLQAQQPYAWQGPSGAPALPLNPQPLPGHPGPQGRMPSGGAFQGNAPARGGPAAHPGKGGDKGARGGPPANGPGRGFNAQNRANGPQGSAAQRAALPANPSVSVNAARAQNGQTRTWGANAASAAPAGNASAPLGGGFQAGRRASIASSVHSDKNGGGVTKKPGLSSQNMNPPNNAPRGPNNARNKAGKTHPNASANGSQLHGASAGQAAHAPGSVPKDVASASANAARSAVVEGSAQDSASASAAVAVKEGSSSSKRAHTDFRILGLEIKELDWSWFAPQALAKESVATDEVKVEGPDSEQPLFRFKAESEEADAEAEQATDAPANGGADGEAAPSADGNDGEREANQAHEENQIVKAEPADEEKEEAEAKPSDHSENLADADADADGDGDGDGDADADAEADGDADADADAEEDITMSHADTDTVASNPLHSVAPTPEPSAGVLSKDAKTEADKPAAQSGKGSKAERAKAVVNLRDSTKLRFCFAAMSNAGPEGAPTGPKAQIQEQTAETENTVQHETTHDPSEPKSAEELQESTEDAPAEDAEARNGTAAENAESKEPAKETSESGAAAAEQEVGDVSAATDSKEEKGEKEETKEEATTTAATSVEQPDVQNQAPVTSEPVQPSEGEMAAAPVEDELTEDREDANGDEESKDAQQTDDAAAAAPAKTKKARSGTAEAVPHAKGPPQLSLNRIFLSFAANRKRLAIDAEAVKAVKIHRSEHWVEIRIDASRPNGPAVRKKGEEYLVCKGTLLERRGKGQENYTAVTRAEIAAAWESASTDVKLPNPTEASESHENDHLELPPFFRLPDPPSGEAELTLRVQLDPSAPLPEPAWLRTNDVAALLAGLQRGSAAVAGQSETAIAVGAAQHVWAGKISVLDPDPPPSMATVLGEWAKESFIGSQKERRKFVDELLGRQRTRRVKVEAGEEEEEESDGERDSRVAKAFVEIVIRLVRGERVALPTTTSGGSSGSLAEILAGATLTTSATYPGLIMLGLLELALNQPGSDAATIRSHVDALLMQLPRATLVKALDLTYKDTVESTRRLGGDPPSSTTATLNITASAPAASGSGSVGIAGASAGGNARKGTGGQTRHRHFNRHQQHGGFNRQAKRKRA